MSTGTSAITPEYVAELEERLASLEKTNAALMRRVERSVDQAGDAYSIFETNILLQAKINERTAELEKMNAELRSHAAVREEAEFALSESEEKFRAIVQAAQDAIIMIDDEGYITMWNEAATALFGWSIDEITCKPFCETLIPTEYGGACRIMDMLRRPPASGQSPGVTQEIWGIRKDGTHVPLELSISMARLRDRVHGIVIARDVTDRKLAEAELRSYAESLKATKDHQEDLTKQLQRLVAELQQARTEAESANRAKSEFLANMSHEIRTPMNAIIGMSELALKTNLDARQTRYLKNVLRSARELLQLINDILDLSKIEAGKLELEETEFCLDEVLSGLAIQLLPKALEKRLDLDFLPILSSHQTYFGDPLRLSQVLLNLLGNAIKFTEIGEVVLEVEETESSGGRTTLRFSVSDTGIGIAPDRLRELFRPFVQADSSTARRFGGTGLGLSISKRLVEGMGGKIWVESESGRGSTFRFTVSFRNGSARTDAFEMLLPELKDTDALVLSKQGQHGAKVAHFLQSLGTDTKAVSSIESASECLEASRNHGRLRLLIIDQSLGKMDVEQLCPMVRTIQQNEPDLKIVVLGFEEECNASSGHAPSLDAIIYKPATATSLIEGMRKALKEKTPSVAGNSNQRTIRRRLAGFKILLTEDTKINQEVATELLVIEGADVDVANDGHEALDMLARNQYDVVLMDVQMPGIDGYQTTKQIRANKQFEELPVLAMTANTMLGDREKAIQSGMNDYVAKPIDPENLVKTIRQWVKKQVPEEQAIDLPVVETGAPWLSPELDPLASFDPIPAIERMGGNIDTYLRILGKAKNSFNETFELLINSLEAGDRETAIRAVHTLKGTAANLGAVTITEIAASIENELRAGQSVGLEQPLARLLDAVMTAAGEIENLLQNRETAGMRGEHGIELNQAEIMEKMEKVRVQILDHDADAIASLESIQEGVAAMFGTKAVDELKAALGRYQFALAEQLLGQLRSHSEADSERAPQ